MVSDPQAEDDDLKYKSAPLDNFYAYNAAGDPYNQSRAAAAGELITEDFCKVLESYKKIADEHIVPQYSIIYYCIIILYARDLMKFRRARNFFIFPVI